MKFTQVLPTDWDIAKPFLQQSCDESFGYTTLDVLQEGLKNKTMGAYAIVNDGVIKAVCVCEIVSYGNKKSFLVNSLAGDDFDLWGEFLNKNLISLAKVYGCTDIQCIGRRGWVKKLAAFGWQEQFTTMGKTL